MVTVINSSYVSAYGQDRSMPTIQTVVYISDTPQITTNAKHNTSITNQRFLQLLDSHSSKLKLWSSGMKQTKM